MVTLLAASSGAYVCGAGKVVGEPSASVDGEIAGVPEVGDKADGLVNVLDCLDPGCGRLGGGGAGI